MITDEKQLQQAIEQMGRMYRALETIQAEVLPQSRQHFALMADGPLEEIRRLEREISAYVEQTLHSLECAEQDAPREASAA
jgi:hypothetical protein